jgi:hypothetical protein
LRDIARVGVQNPQGAPPAPRDFKIRLLSDQDPLWDTIAGSSKLSIYHTREWKRLVEAVFGHRGHYLVAHSKGSILDLLPAFVVNSLPTGKRVISTPYEGCYGGFSTSRADVRVALASHLAAIAKTKRIQHIEIRSRRRMSQLVELGFEERSPLLVSQIDLCDIDTNWGKLSKNHRRNVRLAEKRGVVVTTATNLDEMRRFHDIVARHYHRLGVPFPSRMYFEEIWRRLAHENLARLLLAKIGSEIIGGHLLLLSGRDLISKYSAVERTDRFGKIYASYPLFWEGIQYGVENGYSVFNLGVTGSENQGLLDFKNRFGAQTVPIYFYFEMTRGHAPDYSEYYNRLRFAKRLWRIIPRFVTDPVGHAINKRLC